MSNVIALDTHAAIKRLIEAGFTERQAEAEVSIIADLVRDELVTKSYLDMRLAEIARDIRESEQRMTVRLGGLMAASVAVVAALVKLL